MPFTAFHEYLSLVGDTDEQFALPTQEESQTDYEAGLVQLRSGVWRIRTARLTPKKPGAFVALWMRAPTGETAPIAADDEATGALVFVRENARFGVFRFAAADLQRLRISRSADHPGKRGFRVYPSWCTGLNAQASKTQRAQAPFFEELDRSAEVSQKPLGGIEKESLVANQM